MWGVQQQAPSYTNSTWDAVWTGPGKPPIGPYGHQIGVFNTTYRRAKRCADTYNQAIADGLTSVPVPMKAE